MPSRHYHYVKSRRIRMVNACPFPNKVPESVIRPAKTECQIIELIAEGHHHQKAIAEQSGISPGWVRKVLRELIVAGVLLEKDNKVFLTEI